MARGAYDEQIAIDALQRLHGVQQAISHLGLTALELLPTTDAYCTRCEFFRNKSTDLERGCPGDPASRINAPIANSDAPFGKIYNEQKVAV